MTATNKHSRPTIADLAIAAMELAVDVANDRGVPIQDYRQHALDLLLEMEDQGLFLKVLVTEDAPAA